VGVEGSSSFLKKRTKKLLHMGAALLRAECLKDQKFFASFFQKRSPSQFFLHEDASAMTIEEIRARGDYFYKTIRRRNIGEYLAAAYVAGSFSWRAAVAHGALVRAADVLVAAGALFVAYQLYRRGSARTIAPALDDTSYAAAYRAELCRQRDALNNVLLWYIGPFVPGLALLVIARTAEGNAAHRTLALAGAAVVAFVFAVVWFINAQAARRMQWRIDEMESSVHAPR